MMFGKTSTSDDIWSSVLFSFSKWLETELSKFWYWFDPISFNYNAAKSSIEFKQKGSGTVFLSSAKSGFMIMTPIAGVKNFTLQDEIKLGEVACFKRLLREVTMMQKEQRQVYRSSAAR